MLALFEKELKHVKEQGEALRVQLLFRDKLVKRVVRILMAQETELER